MKLNSIIIILVLSLSILGQSAKPKTIKDLENQIQTFSNNQQYRVAYNAFENFTLVMYGGFNMLGSTSLVAAPVTNQSGKHADDSFLYMSAHFSFDGDKLKKSIKDYGIYFICKGDTCKDISGSNLIVVADDKSLDLGKGGSNNRLMPAPNTKITEFKASKDNLMQIGNAKQVEIKIGSLTRALKPEELKMFVNMATLGEISK